MFRIDTATAAVSEPTPKTPATEGYFQDGNPGTGTPATQLDADSVAANRREVRVEIVVEVKVVSPIDAADLHLNVSFDVLGRIVCQPESVALIDERLVALVVGNRQRMVADVVTVGFNAELPAEPKLEPIKGCGRRWRRIARNSTRERRRGWNRLDRRTRSLLQECALSF